MRALTVRQPWAWATIHGGKDVENRTRSLGPYRGPVAIHAGLVKADLTGGQNDVLWENAAGWPGGDQPRGAVIGVVDLVDVHEERPYWCRETCSCESDWAEIDVYHLVLANPRPLAHPIPWRGRLGLWPVPDELEAAIRAQLGDALPAVTP